MGLDTVILVFWMLSFMSAFSLSSFTFIKRFASSSLLSAINVVESAYLRLLIYLPAILIPACAFHSALHLVFDDSFEKYCCRSVAKSCLTLCNPMNRSTPSLPALHCLPKFAQIHIHWVSEDIQPSHPLSLPSPLALNLYQYQGLFQWISSSHEEAKVLKLQLQHQSFQWLFKVDLF